MYYLNKFPLFFWLHLGNLLKITVAAFVLQLSYILLFFSNFTEKKKSNFIF